MNQNRDVSQLVTLSSLSREKKSAANNFARWAYYRGSGSSVPLCVLVLLDHLLLERLLIGNIGKKLKAFDITILSFSPVSSVSCIERFSKFSEHETLNNIYENIAHISAPSAYHEAAFCPEELAMLSLIEPSKHDGKMYPQGMGEYNWLAAMIVTEGDVVPKDVNALLPLSKRNDSQFVDWEGRMDEGQKTVKAVASRSRQMLADPELQAISTCLRIFSESISVLCLK
nr:tubulin alpha-3 chain-like protein [Ipomoea batatas]